MLHRRQGFVIIYTMLFRDGKKAFSEPEKRSFRIFSGFLIIVSGFLLPAFVGAEVIDRVVAFIDDTAITQTELEDTYAETVKITPGATRLEALETMMNRRLLLREARKLRLKGENDSDILEQYINLKVKAFIRIEEDAVRKFYNENREKMGGMDYSSVRGDIERYLREIEVNRRLRDHLAELREKSYVKILLE